MKQNDQSGMASFLVVTVIVTLLALVSLGFSTMANRESRQALDRQLSDQAYYAAESGVNDALNYINAGIAVGTPIGTLANSTCQLPAGSPNFTKFGNLDATTATKGTIRYSCVLINTTPSQLTFTIPAGQTQTFLVHFDPPKQLDNLYFSWQDDGLDAASSLQLGNYNSPPAIPPNLPQDNSTAPATNATGLLRVGIYPIRDSASQGGHNTNQDLTSDLATYFLYPSNGNGTFQNVTYSAGGSAFVNGQCNTGTHTTFPGGPTSTSYCNAKISNLPNPNYRNLVVSLTAKYKPLKVYVRGTQRTGPTETVLSIPNVQVVIDSTGAGNDVLRRVQATAPLQRNISYGIQSMQAICKLFRVPVVPGGGGTGTYQPAQPDSATPSLSSPDCAVPTGSGTILP